MALNKRLAIAVLRWIAIGIVGGQSVLFARSYAPGTTGHTFTSDDAIPVLMANADRIDAFSLYYWGQDRWGAWPMLAMGYAHRITGSVWSMGSFYLVVCTMLALSAFLIWHLSGRFGVSLALAFAVVVLHWALPILEIAAPYAWQIVSLLAAWAAFRAAMSGRSGWLVVAGCATFLSVWSSPNSILCLPVLFVLDALPGPRDSLSRRVKLAAGTAAAAIPTFLIQYYFHRSAQRAFGSTYATPIELDYKNWVQNIAVGASRIPLGAWGIGLIGLIFFAVHRSRGQWRAENRTALGFLWIAFASFVPTVLFSWVRLNAMDARYFCNCTIFLVLAGVLLVLASLASEIGGLVLVTALSVLALFPIPSAVASKEQQLELELTDKIAASSERPIVMSVYWKIYEFAAARHQPNLTPIVLQGELDRTPWTKFSLRPGVTVLVLRSKGQEAPPILEEYGFSLEILTPFVLSSEICDVASYLVREKGL